MNAYIASIVAAKMNDTSEILNPTFWNPFSPGYGINIFAGILQVAVVIILLAGVDIGKFAVNSFTVIKIILVIFMIVSGLMLYEPANLSAGWAPMGMSGILRGATSCFFGFVGYDEVKCMCMFYFILFMLLLLLFLFIILKRNILRIRVLMAVF